MQSNGTDCGGTLKGSSPGAAAAAPSLAQLKQMWVGIYSTATKDKGGGVENCWEHSSAARQQTAIHLLRHANIWPCTSHWLVGTGGETKLCCSLPSCGCTNSCRWAQKLRCYELPQLLSKEISIIRPGSWVKKPSAAPPAPL